LCIISPLSDLSDAFSFLLSLSFIYSLILSLAILNGLTSQEVAIYFLVGCNYRRNLGMDFAIGKGFFLMGIGCNFKINMKTILAFFFLCVK